MTLNRISGEDLTMWLNQEKEMIARHRRLHTALNTILHSQSHSHPIPPIQRKLFITCSTLAPTTPKNSSLTSALAATSRFVLSAPSTAATKITRSKPRERP